MHELYLKYHSLEEKIFELPNARLPVFLLTNHITFKTRMNNTKNIHKMKTNADFKTQTQYQVLHD